jgi:hypothetical protein
LPEGLITGGFQGGHVFILFGSKTVKTPVKGGLNLRKYCDRCRLLSDLREHSFRQYFTLFFIPVFPISKGESLLICNRCGASFYAQSEDYLGSEREALFTPQSLQGEDRRLMPRRWSLYATIARAGSVFQ